ncbi:MAG TPA: ABC transporter substrate-binding protein, partial [Candidatus Binatia bacterium]|nr:ABC transporter substrate-binding protein [Candidatus Binatia bacterium]
FAVLLFLSCAAFNAQAQVSRIGILVPEMGRAQSQAQKGLVQELKELGYDDRRNIALEIRDARGNRNALQATAHELVAKKIDLIFATGTRASQAAMAATTDVPIVFIHPGDPAVAGLFKSPGVHRRNVTGVAAYAAETTGTRLLLLKEILPALAKVHVFFDSNNSFARENFSLVELASKKLGLQVNGYGVKSVDELKASISALPNEPDVAIFHVPDDLVESEAAFIFESARQKKLATMFNEEAWAIAGAMAAHGPSYLQMGRQAGQLAARILKGQSPGSLPIERAAKFDLTLNYRTATAIGVRLAPEMLKKANRVIR